MRNADAAMQHSKLKKGEENCGATPQKHKDNSQQPTTNSSHGERFRVPVK
jgi:hypothetical protein